MRYLTTIFAVVLCMLFAFGTGTAGETASKASVALMAGGTINNLDVDSDSLGYGGGVKVTFSEHLAAVGFYDYMPTGEFEEDGGKVYGSNISAYGAVTLFDWKAVNFGGLVGLEWATSKASDFLDNSPSLAVGLMGTASLSEKVGVYGTITTPTDVLDDLDSFRGRFGLTFQIF